MSEPRTLTDEQMEQLVNHLLGSCGTLLGALLSLFEIEEDELTIEDRRALDDKIFCCATRGWWFDISEMAESDDHDQKCTECDPPEGDEE